MGTKNNPGAWDCYEEAEPDEPMFVLLGRDPMASVLVELWAMAKVRLADKMPDVPGDLAKVNALAKSYEASSCAGMMIGWATAKGKDLEPGMRAVVESMVEMLLEIQT